MFIVSDGRASILEAAREVYPDVPLQRCLFHIVHQAKKWLTRNPKTVAAQTLSALVDSLMAGESHAMGAWNNAFAIWESFFLKQVAERSYPADPDHASKKWWYTHRNLRRTWRLLKNAQANLWTFLDLELPRFSGSPAV